MKGSNQAESIIQLYKNKSEGKNNGFISFLWVFKQVLVSKALICAAKVLCTLALVHFSNQAVCDRALKRMRASCKLNDHIRK